MVKEGVQEGRKREDGVKRMKERRRLEVEESSVTGLLVWLVVSHLWLNGYFGWLQSFIHSIDTPRSPSDTAI